MSELIHVHDRWILSTRQVFTLNHQDFHTQSVFPYRQSSSCIKPRSFQSIPYAFFGNFTHGSYGNKIAPSYSRVKSPEEFSILYMRVDDSQVNITTKCFSNIVVQSWAKLDSLGCGGRREGNPAQEVFKGDF